MEEASKNGHPLRNFFVSCFITVWLAVAFFGLQTIIFETNDDAAMARILYGTKGEGYDYHLVYINVIAGKFMVFLLKLWPAVPWYTVCQCGAVLLSFFAIIYLLLSHFGIQKGLVPIFLTVFFFGAEFLLKIQFTKTAGISVLAGILLMLKASAEVRKNRIWEYLLGGFLVITGALYRFNALLMVLPPAFFAGITVLWEDCRNKRWKAVFYKCLPFAIVFLICFACRWYNQWSYQQSEDWIFYKEFNRLRSQLLDYGFPDYKANQALYESLNISEKDLAVFKGWDFADPEVFTINAMRQLIAAKETPVFDIHAFVDFLKAFFLDYRYSLASWIAISVGILFYKNNREWLLLLVVLALVGVQCYLFASGRYGKNRVDVTLTLTLFLITTLYCWDIPSLSKKHVSGIMIVLLLVSPFVDYQKKQAEDGPYKVHSLMQSDKNSLYVRTIVSGVPLLPTVYDVYPIGCQENTITLGGWEVYTAPYMRKLRNFRITNLYRDMVNNSDVYLIAGSQLDSRLNYIRRHYYPDANAYLVKVTEDGHEIYRVSTTPGPVLNVSQAIYGNQTEAIRYAFAAESVNGETTFHGYLYKEDENSFASDIYLSLTDTDGTERFYYTAQNYTDALGDLMNGQYSVFSLALPDQAATEFIKLYLDLDDCLYCVHIGTVEQIIMPAVT